MTATEERLAAMDTALARIRRIGEVQTLEPDVVSYSLLSFELSDYRDGALARLRTLLGRFSHLASAESSIESRGQARSVAGWTGDLATVWAGVVAPEQRQAHFALLEDDLGYRVRMILIVTASVQAAASLCAAAASPLMAPEAFRSVTKLVAELESLWQYAGRG
jgi:hypothetical protein